MKWFSVITPLIRISSTGKPMYTDLYGMIKPENNKFSDRHRFRAGQGIKIFFVFTPCRPRMLSCWPRIVPKSCKIFTFDYLMKLACWSTRQINIIPYPVIFWKVWFLRSWFRNLLNCFESECWHSNIDQDLGWLIFWLFKKKSTFIGGKPNF